MELVYWNAAVGAGSSSLLQPVQEVIMVVKISKHLYKEDVSITNDFEVKDTRAERSMLIYVSMILCGKVCVLYEHSAACKVFSPHSIIDT